MAILIPRRISARAQESEDWTSRSSASPEPALWATASGKATLKPYSWRGWKTRPWAQRLFGMICEPSRERAFVDWWISSLEASRASRTQAQESNGEATTNATSSTPSAISLATWHRDSSSWRTCAASLPGMGLDDSLDDWPTSGSMRNGVVYERPMSVPRTAESGSSSWPTAAANWPTPNTRDSASAGRHTTKTGVMHTGTTLTDAMRQWPGPPDQTETGVVSSSICGPHCGTPQGSDMVTGARTAPESRQACLGRDLSRMGKDPKKLNPTFVEWLMGFPSWWSLPCDTASTDSDASETQ